MSLLPTLALHVTDLGNSIALMAPGQLYKPNIFGGNDVVSENLGYTSRPIAPALALSRVVHDYVLELAQLPGAWERFSLRVRLGALPLINPGSEYGDGNLRGALVNLKGNKLLSYQLVNG